MAEETPAAGAQADGAAPQLNVLAQYVKDLSFENPKAPDSLRPREKSPNINIQVNVNGKPLSDTDFEVDLKLEAKAQDEDGSVVFACDLVYSGIFRITGVPKDSLHPVIMIECPRLLFPFARQIIAESTQRGGFPPLMLDPIDFAALYRQRAAEVQLQQAAAEGADTSKPN
ncbi:protein-export chaperone SecB [Coralliovum pocilloporae]|uniref:protein-export chaperone SecB n=1 Tax=Coralliovum pocilloporae TaxID=3066369 RepID=UPI0033072516